MTDSDATAAVAARLGPELRIGDVVLLSGPVGAGKTHFARHLILPILPAAEDIPSPTFTIVQTYDTCHGPLWHSDLYRLTAEHELDELGLPDAFESAICLVEWPGHLGTLRPEGALDLDLQPGPAEDSRIMTLRWQAPKWASRLRGLTP